MSGSQITLSMFTSGLPHWVRPDGNYIPRRRAGEVAGGGIAGARRVIPLGWEARGCSGATGPSRSGSVWRSGSRPRIYEDFTDASAGEQGDYDNYAVARLCRHRPPKNRPDSLRGAPPTLCLTPPPSVVYPSDSDGSRFGQERRPRLRPPRPMTPFGFLPRTRTRALSPKRAVGRHARQGFQPVGRRRRSRPLWRKSEGSTNNRSISLIEAQRADMGQREAMRGGAS